MFDFQEVLVELGEGTVFVVLSRNVGAMVAERFELFLNVAGRSLDVRTHAFEELLVVHLCTSISDDSDVLGEEFVTVLRRDGQYAVSAT